VLLNFFDERRSRLRLGGCACAALAGGLMCSAVIVDSWCARRTLRVDGYSVDDEQPRAGCRRGAMGSIRLQSVVPKGMFESLLEFIGTL
jgi:hypothetical protein